MNELSRRCNLADLAAQTLTDGDAQMFAVRLRQALTEAEDKLRNTKACLSILDGLLYVE